MGMRGSIARTASVPDDFEDVPLRRLVAGCGTERIG